MTISCCINRQMDLPELLSADAKRQFENLSALLGEQDWFAEYLSNHEAELRQVLAVSPFIAGQLVSNPDRMPLVLERVEAPLDCARVDDAIATYLNDIDQEQDFLVKLRHFRLIHMMAIAWRDLTGRAELKETLRSLSALADGLIKVCLTWYYRQLGEMHGIPLDSAGNEMPLVVLGMGKLGAGELNFSSDIDLILAYEQDGETTGNRPLRYHDFFLRVAQKFYKGLNEMTADGFVYRVDLRLRPYGDSGPLVMSFAAMEDYYQTQGREWERYAMVKARAMGMDGVAGEQLLDLLKPFIYRRYLDFGVIQSLRELKEMINREVLRKDRLDNLKLGPGGIREIEFIAQVFQLMRGGQDASLQTREVQTILVRLAEKGLISGEDCQGLLAAYHFLRQAENHIQAMYDRQEHALPSAPLDQARLAFSMGYAEYAAFVSDLQVHRDFVQDCFDHIFETPASADAADTIRLMWQGGMRDDEAQAELARRGFRDCQALWDRLQTIKHKGVYSRLSRQGQEHLDHLIPELLELSSRHTDRDELVRRLLAIVTAIARRESYLALLVEVPAAREQLIRLCGESRWITDVITRHPALLDELIDPRRLYAPPDREELNIELTYMLADLDDDDIEMQMERLRSFKQAQQLRIASADLMGTMPLMVVSDNLTWLAESLVTVALEMAWNYMQERHGSPRYEADGVSHEAQFAVIGYGKLGGIELGYGSDLDLLFVHNSHGQSQQTSGDRVVENQVFFTRLAQRFVHILSTLTPAGVLYEIDTRLRPNGESGLLVTSLESLEAYQRDDAWTWEHQALVRARPVAGGADTATGFETIRQATLKGSRDEGKLREDVLEMRHKMRQELDQSNEQLFDLKQGAGGIVDIEFMVQYLVLRWAGDEPGFVQFTDVIRLLGVARETEKLDAPTCAALIDAYRAYRSRLHHLVLQGEGRCVDAEEFSAHRQPVVSTWQQLFDEKAE